MSDGRVAVTVRPIWMRFEPLGSAEVSSYSHFLSRLVKLIDIEVVARDAVENAARGGEEKDWWDGSVGRCFGNAKSIASEKAKFNLNPGALADWLD